MTEPSWVAQWDRCTKASPSPGVLKMPTRNRTDRPTLREVLPTLVDEIMAHAKVDQNPDMDPIASALADKHLGDVEVVDPAAGPPGARLALSEVAL